MKKTKSSNATAVRISDEMLPPALPIALLKEEDGFVIGIRRSGLTTVPLAVHLVRRDAKGRIVDHEGEGIEGNYGEPIIAYTGFNCEEADIEAAIAEGERLKAEAAIAEDERLKAEAAEAAKPVLKGDLREHVVAARDIIYGDTERLGYRRALLKLHRRLGDDVDRPRLPKDSSAFHAELTCLRQILTEWVAGELDDFEAIEAMQTA